MTNEFAEEIERQPEDKQWIHDFVGQGFYVEWAFSIADVAGIVQWGRFRQGPGAEKPKTNLLLAIGCLLSVRSVFQIANRK